MKLKIEKLQKYYKCYRRKRTSQLAIWRILCFNTVEIVCLIKFYDKDVARFANAYTFFCVNIAESG